MDIRTEGTSLLLDKLEILGENERLKEEEIDEIVKHPDIQQWLKAYDWIDDQKNKFRELLGRLSNETSDDTESDDQDIYNLWLQKIDFGLRKAMKNIEQMQYSLETVKTYDWDSTVQKALDYLPDETELKPVLVLTVDGFNGGMFRHETVYLSLVYLDTSLISEDSFAHELHHMGANYWWEKDPLIQRYQYKKDKQKFYFVQLFTYLVGEGIANAFCSPKAITEVEGEETEQHDKMVRKYQEEIEDIFDKLEKLLENIIEFSEEEVSEIYSGFTMDKENRGIPPGHFLSGRMVQMMDRSSSISRDEILDLIKDPFNFLHIYNKAAEELEAQKFSNELIEKADEFIEHLERKERD